MATTPSRRRIDWDYIKYSNNNYWDSFYVQSYAHFNNVELLHTTTTVSDYESLKITYTVKGSLAAASSSN